MGSVGSGKELPNSEQFSGPMFLTFWHILKHTFEKKVNSVGSVVLNDRLKWSVWVVLGMLKIDASLLNLQSPKSNTKSPTKS